MALCRDPCYKQGDLIKKEALWILCENNGIFAGKLHEIEGQYGRILSRLRVAQYESRDEIRRTIRQLEAECRGTESLLEQSIADCRSPAVSALSAAQLDYDQKVRHILHDELPEYLHEEGNDRIADQAEAASLYGEYAIDFAAQAMRHAMLAALSAIDLQMSCEEAAQKPAENER